VLPVPQRTGHGCTAIVRIQPRRWWREVSAMTDVNGMAKTVRDIRLAALSEISESTAAEEESTSSHPTRRTEPRR
jgi:hypothetical protein